MALCHECHTVIPCHCHLTGAVEVRPGVYLAGQQTGEGDRMSVKALIGEDGRLRIPFALRNQAGIKDGDLVTLRYDGNGVLVLERGESDVNKAKAALADAVNKIVEAERLLKDAADCAPALTTELTRLTVVLDQAGAEIIEARRTLKEKEN